MAKGGWDAPYNWEARLIEYCRKDNGITWDREIMYEGSGPHQAIVCDINHDGINEIVDKKWWSYFKNSKIQIWTPKDELPSFTNLSHRFIDRDKPYTGTDILAIDVDGDGMVDVVCGAWWHKSPNWDRYEIPGICQVLNHYDLDGDGTDELIAIVKKQHEYDDFYEGLSSHLCWLKPVGPENGKWKQYEIGYGNGDWPHGTVIAPILPDGRLALVCCYHSGQDKVDYPEIFEVPEDPARTPWPERVLAKINYGEGGRVCDIDGDGRLDLVLGNYWLRNMGDGNFEVHTIAASFSAAGICIADINGGGRPDVILGEEVLDFENRVTLFHALPGLRIQKIHVKMNGKCMSSIR